MKTFRMIGMALMAVLMCVGFSSCSEDEEFTNGELIEFKGANAYTIDGDFSPVYVTNGKLYNENGNSILYFSLKDVTKYKVTVNPNNKTVNIDKLGDEDLQEGCLIETRYNGTTYASVKTTKGELKDGVYTFTVKFEKKWGYVSLMYNGKYLDPTTTTFAGDIGGYGSTVLYFDSESPAHQLNCCQESGTYVITYNPTTNTVNVAYQG